MEAKRTTKALIAYEKGLDWQELFELAQSDDAEMDEEAVADLAYRVAGQFAHYISFASVTETRAPSRGPFIEKAVCRGRNCAARLRTEYAGGRHRAGSRQCVL